MTNETTLYLTFVNIALLNFGCGFAYCCYNRAYESYAKSANTPSEITMMKIFRAIRIFLLIACVFLSGYFAYFGITSAVKTVG